MAHSNLLTNLLTVRFSKQAQTLFKTAQLPIPLVQRRGLGWLIGLLLLFITSSNLTLTIAKPAVAAAATNLQVDAPTSLNPGPEPSKYRLFLPIVKRP